MPSQLGVILKGEGEPLIPAEPDSPNKSTEEGQPEPGQEVDSVVGEAVPSEPHADPQAEEQESPETGDTGTSTTPRRAFARLRDEEQRVAGGGRWSVDASRRHCHRCAEEIPRGNPFWTVLAEADPDQAGEAVAAFFCRQDHCEGCIESLDEDPFFARWKTTVPAPEGPPRRIVNIASLHATFLSLIDSLDGGEDVGALAGADETADPVSSESSTPAAKDEASAGMGLAQEEQEEPQEEQFEARNRPPRRAALEVSAVTDRIRLAYLLALFLVRKRALRWISHDPQSLTVKERSGAIHRVQVPAIDAAALEEAVAEMEQLLG
ncbi:MAG: hypothetical protein ABGY15_05955 [bacterium]